MTVVVSKWRNSLDLRLPRTLVQQIGICEGQTVSVTVEGNRLIAERAAPTYRLEDPLVNVTPEAIGTAF